MTLLNLSFKLLKYDGKPASDDVMSLYMKSERRGMLGEVDGMSDYD